ncbi:MAG: type II toxin-antitoxin system VapC family toxin [Bryobacteraceae bacterium]
MSVFVDTNILLRIINPADPLHSLSVYAVSALLGSGETLIITPQIMAEFWNGATRPLERNGFGLSIEQAQEELAQIEGFFSIVGETPEVCAQWKLLVLSNRISGVQVHDARLVAAMKVYGMTRILTLNGSDFARFVDIEVVTPQSLA